MPNGSRYKMSRERLDKLKKELEEKQSKGAKEISEQLKEARGFGDASENSELDEAKLERDKFYSRIEELKDLIEHAEVVDMVAVSGTIGFGSRVKVLDIEADCVDEYQIVGSQEADPMDGKISSDSPFGRGMLGHHVGETVTVDAPAGPIVFEILEVN